MISNSLLASVNLLYISLSGNVKSIPGELYRQNIELDTEGKIKSMVITGNREN